MSLYGRLFAALYDRSMRDTEAYGLADRRAALLREASGRVLEIGAGTGLNLPHYPAAVEDLVLTEPEEPMARRLHDKLARVAPGAAARVEHAPAEALPAADGTVDTVVTTLVLCTVADQRRALEEIARVLAPGGRLLFIEHRRSQDEAERRLQDRIDPLWKRVAHGCRCNRDTPGALRASALQVQLLEPFRMRKAPKWVRPSIQGSAAAPTS